VICNVFRVYTISSLCKFYSYRTFETHFILSNTRFPNGQRQGNGLQHYLDSERDGKEGREEAHLTMGRTLPLATRQPLHPHRLPRALKLLLQILPLAPLPETVNIYTHLIGALIAALSSILLYATLSPRYLTASREDVHVFASYFAGAVACLGMSATYHTIQNHSHEVAVWGNKLDYLGIVFLIWGSFIPVLYYAFTSEPELRRTYWAMITTLAAGTSVACVHPSFRTPALRPFRALMFVLMGLSAVFPVLHGIRLYGVEHLRKSIGLDWVLLEGALYITGAGIYAARIPEKWAPGKYDIWGSSHQIFHVLVVLAAASHCVGLVKAFDYAHGVRMGDLKDVLGGKMRI
jgi:adiponectin receptor